MGSTARDDKLAIDGPAFNIGSDVQCHKCDMVPMALAIVADNPVFHDRCNFFAPFAAVEDAIMANFWRHMIFF